MKYPGLIAVFSMLLAPAAIAAEVGGAGLESQLSGATDMTVDIGDQGEWRVIAGGGIGFVPDYPGSGDFKLVLLPLIDIEWRRAYFFSTQRGMGLNFYRKRNWRAGPRFTYDLGRNSSESSTLISMPDIDPSIELGVFFESFSGSWRFKGDLRRGLSGGHNGIVGSLDVAIGGRLTESTNLIVGGVTHITNGSYANEFFGVTTAQATATRVAFAAGGGISDAAGYMNFIHNFANGFFLTVGGRITMLMGDAGDSPLTDMRYQSFVGSVLGFRF